MSGPTLALRPVDDHWATDLPDEAATLQLGARLASVLEPGLRIYLKGNLGAGKTTLVRGILRALGYAGRVKSPTFTLLETYNLSSLYLYHFDLYRFNNPEEWAEAGFDEALGGQAVCIVEWPDKAGRALPPADVTIALEHAGDGRIAHLFAPTQRGRHCLEPLSP